jgi:hypothetical protein
MKRLKQTEHPDKRRIYRARSMTGHNNLGEQFRTGVKGIHGIGEAIRGTAMDTLDTALHANSADRKNKTIADQGFTDIEAADNTFGHHHGVKKSSDATTTDSNAAYAASGRYA